MSEYQYYEFRAIDQPLTKAQMAALRGLSTRAEITPTSFCNTYNWGNLRGSPDRMVEACFDAFVYVANWGARTLMLRIPQGAVPSAELEPYTHACPGALRVNVTDSHMIVGWELHEEPDVDYAGEGWIDRLTPIRDEIVRGDYRSQYIAWLVSIEGAGWERTGHSGDEEDDEEEYAEGAEDETGQYNTAHIPPTDSTDATEPPVPPGVGSLTDAQAALAEFLGVSDDLVAVAAEASAERTDAAAYPERVAVWVSQLPRDEAVAALVRVVTGEGARVQAALMGRYHRSLAVPTQSEADGGMPRRRTGAELLARAEEAANERQRRAVEARDRARRAYLDALIPRLPALWAEADAAASEQKGTAYGRACGLLVDMRAAYDHAGRRPEFDTGFARFLAQHGRRQALVRRLKEAGLL